MAAGVADAVGAVADAVAAIATPNVDVFRLRVERWSVGRRLRLLRVLRRLEATAARLTARGSTSPRLAAIRAKIDVVERALAAIGVRPLTPGR